MTPEPYERLSPRSPDEELFRDALHRTVGPLSLQPDLVADAVREGHRRRARARAFAVAGAFVAVTAVTLGLAALGPRLPAGPEAEPAAPPGPSLSSPALAPSPRRTEPRPEMPSPLPTPESKAPPAEPATPPTSTPPLSAPPGPGHGEATRPEGFRPGPGGAAPACRDIRQTGLTCESRALDDGPPARHFRQPAAGRTGTEAPLRYRSGRGTVALSVSPAPSGAGGAPVTAGALVRVAQSPRFRGLIAYADEHPVSRSGAAS